jgi:hypothetical protein
LIVKYQNSIGSDNDGDCVGDCVDGGVDGGVGVDGDGGVGVDGDGTVEVMLYPKSSIILSKYLNTTIRYSSEGEAIPVASSNIRVGSMATS